MNRRISAEKPQGNRPSADLRARGRIILLKLVSNRV
jgi:hypothetical protein